MNSKLMTIFTQIEDKRRALGRLHNLNDILVMAVVALPFYVKILWFSAEDEMGKNAL